MKQAVIMLDGLTKSYGKHRGIENLTFSVLPGEIFGFIGPNGAGKTTTIRTLMGLLKPTSGNATIFGLDCTQHAAEIAKNVGYLPSENCYYNNLKVKEQLQYTADLYGVNCHDRIEELAERLNLDLSRKIGDLSLGNKKKVGIVSALLPSPKLLILDEPTNGLDPAGIGEIRELIKSLPKRYDMTVLISSHLLSEIEQIATSVGIINDGMMVFQGSMEDLKRKSNPTIMIKTRNNKLAQELLFQKGYSPTQHGDFLVFENLTDEQVARANRSLIAGNIDVLRIEEHKKNLENIFLDITGKERSL